MMSAWRVKSFFRTSGLWQLNDVRVRGCVLSLLPPSKTRSTSLRRSLFVCSRSLASPQGPSPPNFITSHAGGPLAASGILIPKFSCVCITRGKSKKSGKKKSNQKQGDDDDDTEDEGDDDMKLETGTDFREVRARVSSLRLDAILKSGLNMSRNKVESAFYASKIRINGKKLLKKSIQCHQGDEIDVIKSVSRQNPKYLYVSRVVLVALGDLDDDSDKVTVKLRRYPNLLVECYKDYKVPDEEE